MEVTKDSELEEMCEIGDKVGLVGILFQGFHGCGYDLTIAVPDEAEVAAGATLDD